MKKLNLVSPKKEKLKKIEKAIDKKYIETLFNKNKKNYFPGYKNEEIKNIEIKKQSPDWAKETCLVQYKIYFKNGNLFVLRGSAKLYSSKKDIWTIMNNLQSLGFQSGEYRLPRPIDYIENINLLIYEEVPGEPLVNILKNQKNKREESLVKTSNWLKKLHSSSTKGFPKAIFPGVKGYKKILKNAEIKIPSLSKYKLTDDELKKIENVWKKEKTVIHNDFYPGNAIVDDLIFYGIDFDRSGIGHPLMDIATICGALEFPQEIWESGISESESQKLQKIFINSYQKNLNKSKNDLKILMGKIFLDQVHYYSYFTIKGWNFMDEQTLNNYIQKIEILLKKSKTYLK